MNQSAIKIRGLRKNFSQFSLGPLEMTVPAGGIYGFIGPNGSGKTTTIDLILGMGRKDAGDVQVLGLDHCDQEVEIKRNIGYVSPELNFHAWGIVGQAIQFARGFYPKWDQTYCEKLLHSFGLAVGEKILTLSFGSKIKLALIIALSHRPCLLILDEPTVGLDALSKQEVFAELLAAVEDGERTVLISSHSLTDVERFADSIGMIKNGLMLLEGTTTEVVDRFRMVDFINTNGLTTQPPRGLYLLAQEKERHRALVDTKLGVLDWIKNHGAGEISVLPVTLEEVFLALAKDR
jgi:ABC-2 type transport system ATP-binding protein